MNSLGGLMVIEPTVYGDDRGFFLESYNRRRFHETVGIDPEFVQDNHSCSAKGVLRGLHYQIEPHPQGKLVRVISGQIWDVAVDIRRSSPTFGKWAGFELSAANKRQLWIPEGFAHGFVALSDGAEILYKTTEFFAPDCDRSIRWNDSDIGIVWPVDGPPLLSAKDEAAPFFCEAEVFD